MSDQNKSQYSVPYRSSEEIRADFINFFNARGHKVVPAANIAPQDDPSLLFTNAGMNQFKAIFLGDNKEGLKRAVNSQKCLRVSGKHNDLDEVGRDGTHHTFFEMLGNWSFGDFYKKEAIAWAWELLTEVWKLPKDRLFATVYTDDDEAHQIWESVTDINREHILRFESDNFWEMGSVGPCGPCSEIHFDLGDMASQKETFADPILGVNGENQRYIEIWNLVFIQYERLANSELKKLTSTHVDTGSGFERLCGIIQQKNSNYDSDVFSPLIENISKLSNTPYCSDEGGLAHRVIADHIRALTFTITDGVTPGNEGRGYVMRRILRRASRFAHQLGCNEPFLYKLVPVVVAQMSTAFPELKSRADYVAQVIKAEEKRFLTTLAKGLEKLEKLIVKTKKSKAKELSGKDVFLFHDSYGFPFDLTALIAEENSLGIDEAGFKVCMNEQKERARKSAKFDDSFGSESEWTVVKPGKDTLFTGYTSLMEESQVLRFRELGDHVYVVLEQSPFYPEAGGQVGDTGVLKNDHLELRVEDTLKVFETQVQKCSLVHGLVDEKTVQKLTAQVDPKNRERTKANHSATHILHAALRAILGEHVEQQGSYVGPERLRFDFTHHQGLSSAELKQIELWVNEKLRRNVKIQTSIMPVAEAKKKGAMALFGEKYGDTVRVLEMGDFSTELCGGTHASSTGEIGLLRILSESSIAAGVRRIEAITSQAALEFCQDESMLVHELGKSLKAKPDSLLQKTSELSDKVRVLEKELAKLRAQDLQKKANDLLAKHRCPDKRPMVIVEKLDESQVAADSIQEMIDILAGQLEDEVVVLTHVANSQLSILAAVGKPALKSFKAGEIVKNLAALAGGKGGGRPDKARAGSKHPEHENLVLETARSTLKF